MNRSDFGQFLFLMFWFLFFLSGFVLWLLSFFIGKDLSKTIFIVIYFSSIILSILAYIINLIYEKRVDREIIDVAKLLDADAATITWCRKLYRDYNLLKYRGTDLPFIFVEKLFFEYYNSPGSFRKNDESYDTIVKSFYHILNKYHLWMNTQHLGILERCIFMIGKLNDKDIQDAIDIGVSPKVYGWCKRTYKKRFKDSKELFTMPPSTRNRIIESRLGEVGFAENGIAFLEYYDWITKKDEMGNRKR